MNGTFEEHLQKKYLKGGTQLSGFETMGNNLVGSELNFLTSEIFIHCTDFVYLFIDHF